MKSPIYLNALRAFEASARHQSFSAAAVELNVTPAAVGQLVRGLEEWIGQALFHRVAGGRARLLPTEVAHRALPDIRAGFDRLNLGLERLKEVSERNILTVTLSPAFAAKWLLPRIERFQSLWPDIDLRLETSPRVLDFAAQGIDIGVRYGAGAWPGLVAEKLMDEEVFPVCAPRLLEQQDAPKSPSDLAHLTLIHDLSLDSQTGFASWDTWFQQLGLSDVSSCRGLQINNSAGVLQATIDGRGVALARSSLVKEDLAFGRLLRLFPEIEMSSKLTYFVVYRADSANQPKICAFRNWIMAEATSTASATSVG